MSDIATRPAPNLLANPLVKAGLIVAAIVAALAIGVRLDSSNTLYAIFVDPFQQMVQAPDLLVQTVWEGLVSGVLYALIALGFVLIFKASGVFNFAQGIMVVFAALTLVGLYEKGVPAFLAVILTLGVMFALAVTIERVVLRPLVNQPDIILFMATFGITYFLIGFGESLFGGNPKQMIAEQLYLPKGAVDLQILGGLVSLQKIDIAAAVIASLMIAALAAFFQYTRIGRALRVDADDGGVGHARHAVRHACAQERQAQEGQHDTECWHDGNPGSVGKARIAEQARRVGGQGIKAQLALQHGFDFAGRPQAVQGRAQLARPGRLDQVRCHDHHQFSLVVLVIG